MKLRRSDALLIVVCLAQFMVILDVSIVNVALPSIQDGLHFSDHRPAVGRQRLHAHVRRLPDARRALRRPARPPPRVPRRHRALRARLARLRARRLRGLLLGARALQGFGGAVISPASLAIITTSFAEGAERNRAARLWGAMGGSAAPRASCSAASSRRPSAGRRSSPSTCRSALAVIVAGRRADPGRRGPPRARHFDVAGAVPDHRRPDRLRLRHRPHRHASAGARRRARAARRRRWSLLALFAWSRAGSPRTPLIPLRPPHAAAARRQPDRRAALRRDLRDVVLRLALPAGSPRLRRARGRARFLPMTLSIFAGRRRRRAGRPARRAADARHSGWRSPPPASCPATVDAGQRLRCRRPARRHADRGRHRLVAGAGDDRRGQACRPSRAGSPRGWSTPRG